MNPVAKPKLEKMELGMKWVSVGGDQGEWMCVGRMGNGDGGLVV